MPKLREKIISEPLPFSTSRKIGSKIPSRQAIKKQQALQVEYEKKEKERQQRELRKSLIEQYGGNLKERGSSLISEEEYVSMSGKGRNEKETYNPIKIIFNTDGTIRTVIESKLFGYSNDGYSLKYAQVTKEIQYKNNQPFHEKQFSYGDQAQMIELKEIDYEKGTEQTRTNVWSQTGTGMSSPSSKTTPPAKNILYVERGGERRNVSYNITPTEKANFEGEGWMLSSSPSVLTTGKGAIIKEAKQKGTSLTATIQGKTYTGTPEFIEEKYDKLIPTTKEEFASSLFSRMGYDVGDTEGGITVSKEKERITFKDGSTLIERGTLRDIKLDTSMRYNIPQSIMGIKEKGTDEWGLPKSYTSFLKEKGLKISDVYPIKEKEKGLKISDVYPIKDSLSSLDISNVNKEEAILNRYRVIGTQEIKSVYLPNATQPILDISGFSKRLGKQFEDNNATIYFTDPFKFIVDKAYSIREQRISAGTFGNTQIERELSKVFREPESEKYKAMLDLNTGTYNLAETKLVKAEKEWSTSTDWGKVNLIIQGKTKGDIKPYAINLTTEERKEMYVGKIKAAAEITAVGIAGTYLTPAIKTRLITSFVLGYEPIKEFVFEEVPSYIGVELGRAFRETKKQKEYSDTYYDILGNRKKVKASLDLDFNKYTYLSGIEMPVEPVNLKVTQKELIDIKNNWGANTVFIADTASWFLMPERPFIELMYRGEEGIKEKPIESVILTGMGFAYAYGSKAIQYSALKIRTTKIASDITKFGMENLGKIGKIAGVTPKIASVAWKYGLPSWFIGSEAIKFSSEPDYEKKMTSLKEFDRQMMYLTFGAKGAEKLAAWDALQGGIMREQIKLRGIYNERVLVKGSTPEQYAKQAGFMQEKKGIPFRKLAKEFITTGEVNDKTIAEIEIIKLNPSIEEVKVAEQHLKAMKKFGIVSANKYNKGRGVKYKLTKTGYEDYIKSMSAFDSYFKQPTLSIAETKQLQPFDLKSRLDLVENLPKQKGSIKSGSDVVFEFLKGKDLIVGGSTSLMTYFPESYQKLHKFKAPSDVDLFLDSKWGMFTRGKLFSTGEKLKTSFEKAGYKPEVTASGKSYKIMLQGEKAIELHSYEMFEAMPTGGLITSRTARDMLRDPFMKGYKTTTEGIKVLDITPQTRNLLMGAYYNIRMAKDYPRFRKSVKGQYGMLRDAFTVDYGQRQDVGLRYADYLKQENKFLDFDIKQMKIALTSRGEMNTWKDLKIDFRYTPKEIIAGLEGRPYKLIPKPEIPLDILSEWVNTQKNKQSVYTKTNKNYIPLYPQYNKPYITTKAYSNYQKYDTYKVYNNYNPYTEYAVYESYNPYKPYIPYQPYNPYKPYIPYQPYNPYKPYIPYQPYKTPPKEPPVWFDIPIIKARKKKKFKKYFKDDLVYVPGFTSRALNLTRKISVNKLTKEIRNKSYTGFEWRKIPVLA